MRDEVGGNAKRKNERKNERKNDRKKREMMQEEGNLKKEKVLHVSTTLFKQTEERASCPARGHTTQPLSNNEKGMKTGSQARPEY